MNMSVYRARALAVISAAFLILLLPEAAKANLSPDHLADGIRMRLVGQDSVILTGQAVVYAPSVLQKLYGRRAYQPVWICNEEPLPRAGVLLNAIGLAFQEGLNPYDYHFAEIKTMILEWQSQRQANLPFPTGKMIDLELLLTDALVAYGFHLLNGRVDAEKLYSEWVSYEKEVHLYDVIERAVHSGDVDAALKRLTPHTRLYRDLKQTLAAYRTIAEAGGWPLIPKSPSQVRKVDYERYISLLRQRLLMTGDLPPSMISGRARYDENLKSAVRRLQKRHGLKADGKMNQATLKEMNATVETRIRQIVLNLEKLRWLPEEIGRRYILVNIADFELLVFENDSMVMSMPIVVGRQNQRTSVFHGKMTHIELNPYWNVPKSIAEKEILPQIQKDPEYLTKKKIKVVEYSRPEGVEIDPSTIDWSKVKPDKLRYNFRQDSGPGNALGRIKFIFPNKFDIYLHDTPERHLFRRSNRTFSHGCIRIARPIDLAEYLLKNENGWDRKEMMSAIKSGERQVLKLKNQIDVHILYLTAWADHQGDFQLRSDVYSGDAPLQEALNEKPRIIKLDDVGRFRDIPGPYGESF